MEKGIELLLEAAKIAGETPLEFYDHLSVAKENWGTSPLYKEYQDGLLKEYVPSKDPYVPACIYFEKSCEDGSYNANKILELKREYVSDFIDGIGKEKGEKSPLEVAQTILNFDKKNISPSQRKDVYINKKYFQKNFDSSFFGGEAGYNSFISRSKKTFRDFLASDHFSEYKEFPISFIEENLDLILSMKRNKSDKMSHLYIPINLWNRLDEFRSSKIVDLSRSDIARGLFFYVFDVLVRGYIDEKKSKK